MTKSTIRTVIMPKPTYINNMQRDDSPIFSKTYDLLRWLIPLTLKFPRQQRFVLAQSLQQTVIGLQETLIEAAYRQNPVNELRNADIQLAKLRFHFRLSHDLQLISTGQYQHVSQMLGEIGRLLGGWQKKLKSMPASPTHQSV